LQPVRDAKAELNRRSQVCEILAGTGISRRKSIPKRTEPGARPLLRPCEVSAGMTGSLGKMDEHQGIAPCIPRWKRSVYLSTPMLGEMACQPQPAEPWGKSAYALCASARQPSPATQIAGEGWNPVLELHQSRHGGTAA
jgi:hypothetical protein